jgi:hypothetical protein
MDYLTGQGVTVPCVLTNGATTCTLPNQNSTYASSTINVLDGNNQPTGIALVTSSIPESFYAVPIDRNFMVFPTLPPPVQGPIPLQTGMLAQGVLGLAAGTTITVNSASSITLSAAFTGTTGVYYVNFANNYWAKTALATITLSGSATTYDGDLALVTHNVKYIRANVTAVTGTNPVVQVWMGA